MNFAECKLQLYDCRFTNDITVLSITNRKQHKYTASHEEINVDYNKIAENVKYYRNYGI